MKKLLLLATVAAMGVGYCSEDWEKKINGEHNDSPSLSKEINHYQENFVNTGTDGIKLSIGLSCLEKYKIIAGNPEIARDIALKKGFAVNELADEDVINMVRMSLSEADSKIMKPHMHFFKKCFLQEMGVAENVTNYLLADAAGSYALFIGESLKISEKSEEIQSFHVESFRLENEIGGETLVEREFANFIVGQISISNSSIDRDLIVLGNCIAFGDVTIGRYLFALGTITVPAESKLVVRDFILPGSFPLILYGELFLGSTEDQKTTRTPGTYILKNETNNLTTTVELHDGGRITYGPGITVVEFSPTVVAETMEDIQ